MFLFSCYEKSKPEQTTGVIYNRDVSSHPLKVGGFKIGVKLPIQDGIIDNSLHSELSNGWLSP
jgi:hypothetical protein